MNSAQAISVPGHWPQDSDWTSILSSCFSSPGFQSLMDFVNEQRSSKIVFPAREKEFNAFRLCPFQQTSVVILGQDPYHGVGQAHGLAFSVPTGQKLPPSLRNIFAELENDLGINNHSNGDLTSWAKQGVLLLNTVLTVDEGKAHSHRNRGWEEFTDRVIESLGNRTDPAVFILWGKPAESKRRLIKPHHTIIQSPHPSPLSAYRGFFNSKPFSIANGTLKRSGTAPIDWQL